MNQCCSIRQSFEDAGLGVHLYSGLSNDSLISGEYCGADYRGLDGVGFDRGAGLNQTDGDKHSTRSKRSHLLQSPEFSGVTQQLCCLKHEWSAFLE
jgi:hypothetical protein